MGGVDSHPGRLLSRSGRPVGHDAVRRGVDHCHFIFIFKIVVNPARFRIGGGKFRLALQRNGCDDLAGFGVDDCGGMAAPIEQVGLLLARLVKQSIRILPGIHLGKRLQGL